MYAKLFASLYQGTLRGCADEILVFTNLLAHADKHGIVDKHYRAISEETGLPEDRVRTAIANLEAPDPESRSPEMEGRRITPMDEHRAWGWQIVNHGKYRAIKNEDDRREQNRLAQQKWREKHSKQHKQGVSKRKRDKPIQIQITDTEEEKRANAPTLNTVDWFNTLKVDALYAHVDIDREREKAERWIANNPNRRFTRKFFLSWINKIEPPLVAMNGHKTVGCEVCLNHPDRDMITVKGGGYICNRQAGTVVRCACNPTNGTA